MKLELSAISNVLQVPAMFEVVGNSEAAFNKIDTWPYLSTQRQNVLILCGASGITRRIAERFAAFFRAGVDPHVRLHEIRTASLRESRGVDALCAQEGVTLLVAVGGGKVVDTAKMVRSQRNIALLCIPSALSSDGITSPVAVLADDEGRVQSLPAGIPSYVLVDLSITTQAPVALTLSGIGDILSNASALLDVDEYEARSAGRVNGFAKLLSHSACQMVFPLTREEVGSPDGQEAIARALILSGLSMAFSGNSLPCSGGEHLISHALDHLGYGTGTHGLQVAITTLYCLSLRQILGRPAGSADVRETMARLGLPMRPEEIGVSRREFMEAIRVAPDMRRGRVTILQAGPDEGALEAAYDHAFTGAFAGELVQ